MMAMKRAVRVCSAPTSDFTKIAPMSSLFSWIGSCTEIYPDEYPLWPASGAMPAHEGSPASCLYCANNFPSLAYTHASTMWGWARSERSISLADSESPNSSAAVKLEPVI